MEFYLFQLDSQGNPSREPHDHAGYMDMAPGDRGENVRREICLTLEQMGIRPESSHHEEGPGQNEIDFRYSDPLTAADNAMTFQTVVKTAAAHNGLWADFSPKPLPDLPGNGFHINLSVQGDTSEDLLPYTIAGILDKIRELTVFLNPCRQSYHRFGVQKAPAYISWSANNRSQLIRIPAATGEYRRAELRSPDTSANPYLAFSLLIEAGLSGIAQKLSLVPPTEVNLYTADKQILSGLCRLPTTLEAAVDLAEHSPFITRCLPAALIQSYCRHR